MASLSFPFCFMRSRERDAVFVRGRARKVENDSK